MTVAAGKLATTSMTILEIALHLCYDSQESFTRAFKSRYYMTPGKYRRFGLHFAVIQKKRLLYKRNLIGLEGRKKMEPKTLHKPAFKVIGLKYYGNDPANNCPDLWRDFQRLRTSYRRRKAMD